MNLFKKLEISFLIFLISGCTISVATKPQKEIYTYHIVKKGENLFRISKYYYEEENVEKIKEGVEKIKKANNLKDENIYEGQKLLIPDTKKTQPSYALLPPSDPKITQFSIEEKKDKNISIIKESPFIWPVEGKIICKFGELGNKGIDLMVEPGSYVVSSADGEVVFSGKTKKYDETIIIKHPFNFYTVYAHDFDIKVKNGDKVKQGDIIARVKSGTQKKRYIHFEIIKENTYINPLEYLPLKNGKTGY
ncbi:MAG: peptidoglycan DD-metalloendopeptidase family protein [Candidatus Omnitrophica bacterium]|nr:peptidoglycan DD-metalloendopeptidase family protein [Candidatus Omnitrophota bacterium]